MGISEFLFALLLSHEINCQQPELNCLIWQVPQKQEFIATICVPNMGEKDEGKSYIEVQGK